MSGVIYTENVVIRHIITILKLGVNCHVGIRCADYTITDSFHLSMRMPIADILHRGVVTSLVGLTLYGVFLGGAVHRETLRKGRGEQTSALI